jgi:hypothetical protein
LSFFEGGGDMAADELEDDVLEDKIINLSLDIKTKSSKTSWLSRFLSIDSISPVQGEPFSWGVEVKNISTIPSPEVEIIRPYIVNLENNYCEESEKTITVRSLNPNEAIFVDIDKCTVFLEGVMWAKLLINSKVQGYEVVAYQFDGNHGKLAKCGYDEDNEVNWLKDIYVHKKSEVLQGRTNNLIIVLTALTVVEAVFTIKECIRFLLWCGAEFFGLFVSLFSFLGGMV